MSEQARQTTKATPNIASIPGNVLQRQCDCGQHTGGSECEECRKKNEGTLQRAAVSPGPVNSVPPVVHDVLRSSGQPLDAATRSFMEPRFGHDFSQVRLHTDGRAAESARAVNALAYTVGRDVVFGAGQYAPVSMQGMRLLGHELTHVIQQDRVSNSDHTQLALGQANDSAEAEAEQVGRTINVSGGSTKFFDFIGRASPSLIWRQVAGAEAAVVPNEGLTQRSRSEDCSRYINQSGLASCEFYRCREANNGNQCGQSGYYLGYGLKYCERFSRVLRPILSEPGQRWLDRTRVCLMQHIQDHVPYHVPFDFNCDAVKRSAFDSHPNCYVQGGICFLPSSDWQRILNIIDSADNDLKQAIITGISCLANWGALVMPIHSTAAGGGLGGLMERDRRRVFGF
ncbi:MAG: DUF4157 domain-containing protein [Herpetosiphonaceae bacterium]|nr:DUF4157 domain-containing protein [Herpetosiphonaceae bacterium]